MSIRSYANDILFETVFDSLPDNNTTLSRLADQIFSPRLTLTESDCGTTLGKVIPLTYEAVGYVELTTGNALSLTRIRELLDQDLYTVSVRSTSSCIAKEGLCQACYHASRQYAPNSYLGESIVLQPEFVVGADAIPVEPEAVSVNLSTSSEYYETLYLYYEDSLLNPNLYSISGTVLTFNEPLPGLEEDQVTARFTTTTRSPFMSWLATTYSGAMLGLKGLPFQSLPLKRSKYASLVPGSVVESLAESAYSLKEIPDEVLSMIGLVRDPFEKALYVMALLGIYSNVN